MSTDPMALTGYIDICREFPNLLGIHSLGNPSTGSFCDGCLFYNPGTCCRWRCSKVQVNVGEYSPIGSMVKD